MTHFVGVIVLVLSDKSNCPAPVANIGASAPSTSIVNVLSAISIVGSAPTSCTLTTNS